jgi:hypothetical protein
MMEEEKQVFKREVSFRKSGSWMMTLPKILAYRWGMDSDRSYIVTIEPIGHRKAIIEVREGR